jgi:tetratricopeptide (TPR) repeat protein
MDKMATTQIEGSTNRQVRIFISSTFMDMQEEREELVKFVFPELRRRCRERKVEFVGVDLRWGITDEQASEGKVLPICLAEIEGCRPYFIGILGERYGWVPNEIDDEIIERQQWLNEHKEKSVTELEILHGVLNDPEMKGLAFFYFRDKKKSETIEKTLSNEMEYSPEPEDSNKKLINLKQKIEESNYTLKKDYSDAKALGQWVIDDLWSAIDKRFPKEQVPTELEQRRIEHEAFAALRRKVYIGREKYFSALDKHAQGDGPPLVVLGESGSGKSALLANWAERYQQEHPDDFMVCHYIGSTADSADYIQMLRRIMKEIQQRYEPQSKIKEDSISSITKEESGIPTDPKRIVEVFPLWLGRAAANGKIILIIDALNQIEDKDNAPDLSWLPWSFSPNVRLIVSTLPGRSYDALKKREWSELIVSPMQKDEQERYIIDYLKQYSKQLNPAQIKRVLKEEQTSNPLYLRTLLEELRVFGKYHELDKEIEHYLKANTVEELFNYVLERLEKDYENERKGLVKGLLTLIWASRRGLSETEILELLGTGETPMPRAFFSTLYLALEESLVNRSGLLAFFHDFLRKAVETRYLPNLQDKKDAHLTIANFFERKTLDDRKVDELPWQFCQAKAWQRLKDCVTDINIFQHLMNDGMEYELTGYWLSISNRYDMVEEYNVMLALYEGVSPDPLELGIALGLMAYFFLINAKYDDAETQYSRVLDIREKALGPEHPDTAESLNNLGVLLYYKGDYGGAEPLCRRALDIREKVFGPEHSDIASSLNNLAELLRIKGDYDGAELLCRRSLGICEKALGPEHPDIASSLNNLAELLRIKGDYDGAEPLYRKALGIIEKAFGPEHPDTNTFINNLALLLSSQGDYDGAELLCRRTLGICEKAFGPEHPDTATSLNSLASVLYNKGDYDSAEQLCRRTLGICEKAFGPGHPNIASSLNNLAELLRSNGDYDGAEQLCRRALDIHEKAFGPGHPDTALSLSNLAALLRNNGDYDGAEPLCRRALDIYEKEFGPEHPDTAISLNNLALLLYSKGDYDGAEPLYQRALGIYEKVLGPEHPDTAPSLNNLALLLYSKGDYEGAEPLYRRALGICEKALDPEHHFTAQVVNSLADLLYNKGDYDEAKLLFHRALTIREKVFGPDHPNTVESRNSLAKLIRARDRNQLIESKSGGTSVIDERDVVSEDLDTATRLNDQAGSLENKGDYKGAERLLRRALAITEKALGPDHFDTAESLNNFALLLKHKGDYERAEPMYRRALAIYEKILGFEHPEIATTLNNLASLLKAKGDNEEAELLYQRALKINENVLGPDHPDTAQSLINLALLFKRKGDYEKAESMYHRALEINKKAFGFEHPETAATLNKLAGLLRTKKDYKSAEIIYRKAQAIYEKVLGPDHPDTNTNRNNLATLLYVIGDHEGAKSL